VKVFTLFPGKFQGYFTEFLKCEKFSLFFSENFHSEQNAIGCSCARILFLLEIEKVTFIIDRLRAYPYTNGNSYKLQIKSVTIGEHEKFSWNFSCYFSETRDEILRD
jgi:hypothetical protein